MHDHLERRPARGSRDVSRHAVRLAEDFREAYKRHGDAVRYVAQYDHGAPRLEVRRKALRIADLEAKLGLPRRTERRAVPAASTSGPVLRGLAIVFNSLSVPIAGFRERIRPSAIRRTLDEGIDVRAFADHDSGKVLGRLTAKTLGLHVDRVGLHVTITPPDTTYARDLVAVVKRGDLSNMSFGFSVLTDEWEMQNGTAVRNVTDMRVYEVSPVSLASYGSTTITV